MKLNHIVRVITACLFFFTLDSCQKPIASEEALASVHESNTVTLTLATKIAEVQAPVLKSNVASGRVGSKKKVKSLFTVQLSGEAPLMYIINYEGGGFILISGDNRITPVLAYSEINPFPTDQKRMPGGLLDWFSGIDETVKKIRATSEIQDPSLKKVWDRFTSKVLISDNSIKKSARTTSTVTYDGDCNDGSTGYTQYTEQSPLTQSIWDQNAGYNNELAFASCAGTGNGRFWTGCVATAIAQIMRYHQHPSSYNWGAMPLDRGSGETSRLMRDLGTSSNLDMDYSCDGSGAKMARIPHTLRNFGYSGGSDADYNYFTVKGEVVSGYPVILTGGTRGGWWIFGQYKDGHAWVCDGVQERMYYVCQPDPNTPGEQISVYAGHYDAFLYMNWGWGPHGHNGWFSAFNWNPAGMSFNYRQKMVTGIRK